MGSAPYTYYQEIQSAINRQEIGGASLVYTLPTATATVLGGIKLGTGLTDGGGGVINVTGGTPAVHNLVDSTNHPISVASAGLFLKSTATNNYAFGAHGLTYTDVGAAASSHNHQNLLSDHIGEYTSSHGVVIDNHLYGSYDVIAYQAGTPDPGFWSSMPTATTTTVGGFKVYDTQFHMDAGFLHINDSIIVPANHDIISAHTATVTDGQFLRGTGTNTFAWETVTYSDIGAASAGHNHSGVYEPADSDIQTHLGVTSGNPHGTDYTDVGAVAALGTVIDNAIIRANGTGGDSLQQSLATIGDDGTVIAEGDIVCYSTGGGGTPLSADSFKTWHISSDSGYTWGSSDVVASTTDIMDVVAGTNIVLATDATSKAIRITASGVLTSYPASGIVTSTGSAWGTSITDNSANWNSAYGWGNWASNFGSTAGKICQGNDSRLSDSRPASDVYTWAKAATKPSYSYSEVGAEPANANIQSHISSTSNPHSTSASQVGLGNVTNESKATMFTSPTFTGGNIYLTGSILDAKIQPDAIGMGISTTPVGGGGWARRYGFYKKIDGTDLGGFGGLGGENTLDYYFVGKAYNDTCATFYPDGEAQLYYDGNVRLQTKTDGVYVTGNNYIKGVGNRLYFDTTGMGNANYIGVTDDYKLLMYCGRGSSSKIILNNTGEVELYYGSNIRLFTRTDGVTSYGTLTADSEYAYPQLLLTYDATNGMFFHSQGTTSHYNWRVGHQHVVSGLDFTRSSAVGGTTFNATGLVITNDLYVGIACTAPGVNLQVGGTAAGTRAIRLHDSVHYWDYIHYAPNNYAYWAYDGTDKMYLTTGGNLNITGDFIAGGNEIYLNGTNYLSGDTAGRIRTNGNFHASGDVVAYSS